MSGAIPPLTEISFRAEHITSDFCPAYWHYDIPRLVTDSTSFALDRTTQRGRHQGRYAAMMSSALWRVVRP